jgi:hypothetical protein
MFVAKAGNHQLGAIGKRSHKPYPLNGNRPCQYCHQHTQDGSKYFPLFKHYLLIIRQNYNFFIQIGKKGGSNLSVSEKNSNFALAKTKKGD